MLVTYGMRVISTGKRLKHKGLQGDFDIEVEYIATGKRAIVDIKSSGLINDKWNEYGWSMDGLEYKDRLMIQVVQYKLLGIEEYGYEPDFYFFIFSNTNTIERKAFQVVVDEDRFTEHLETIKKVKRVASYHEKNGWTPRPDVKRCHDCPLKKDCKHFIDIPIIETVYY